MKWFSKMKFDGKLKLPSKSTTNRRNGTAQFVRNRQHVQSQRITITLLVRVLTILLHSLSWHSCGFSLIFHVFQWLLQCNWMLKRAESCLLFNFYFYLKEFFSLGHDLCSHQNAKNCINRGRHQNEIFTSWLKPNHSQNEWEFNKESRHPSKSVGASVEFAFEI